MNDLRFLSLPHFSSLFLFLLLSLSLLCHFVLFMFCRLCVICVKFPGKLPTDGKLPNQTYAYNFRGQVVNMNENGIDIKAIFDPEIFFNIILPPIIFYAGYSLKRVIKHAILRLHIKNDDANFL